MSSWTANDMPDQAGRIVVITGANSGVGYESAVAFARKRAHVIMACRSAQKADQARQALLKQVPGAKIDVLPLDLGSLKSVRSFAETFSSRYDRLDILMNNAGIMIPPYGKTADGFETQFGTNHLGHFALTGLLLPSLLRTPASRIVTVSSGAAQMNARINFDDLQSEKQYVAQRAYNQSKLANLLFMLELQRRLEAMHATTISVASQPGLVRTNLLNHPISTAQRLFYSAIVAVASQDAEHGAMCQLYAATAPGVHGGDYFQPRLVNRGAVVRTRLPARAQDTAVAARLWQVSETLTGVRYDALRAAAA